MTEWQPIETAPKTGWILLYADSGLELANWNHDQWQRVETAEYGNDFIEIHGASHWMLLPEPPK